MHKNMVVKNTLVKMIVLLHLLGALAGVQSNKNIKSLTQNVTVQSKGNDISCESFNKGDDLRDKPQMQLAIVCYTNSLKGQSLIIIPIIVDTNNLQSTTIENNQKPQTPRVLTLHTNPHGVVVTLNIAWSFATNYVEITALMIAIQALRRRQKFSESEEDIYAILKYLLYELQDYYKDQEFSQEMLAIASQLQQIITCMDSKLLHNFEANLLMAVMEFIDKIPDAVLSKKGWNRKHLKKLLSNLSYEYRLKALLNKGINLLFP